MLDRTELAAFLRGRRARRQPGDVGLPETGRRRTPGLRRQEVAQLAGMSVEYYIRLEQARGPRPSAQVLSALARALVLNTDERDYLFRLAGASPPTARRPSREITTAMRYLLDGLTSSPAYVLDAKYDVLAWNRLAPHFIGDMAALPESRRNIIEWRFSLPADDPHWDDPDATCFARSLVADLRVAYARYPGDPDIARLVTTLRGTSPHFEQMWESGEVQERRGFRKHVDHPLAGPVEFECQVLNLPDTDQRVMLYCPEPGSATEQAMHWLADQQVSTFEGRAPCSSGAAVPAPAETVTASGLRN